MNCRVVVSFIAVLIGCTHPVSVSAPVPAKGKPVAPVAVTAELSAKSAHLLLRFEAEAEDAEVAVGGVDGLVVDGPRVVAKGHFAKGETRAFDVGFQPGPGRSQLVVTVKGRFNGASRARVVAFGVGSGASPESPGEVMTTDDGERVKVLPAATH